MKRLIFLVSMVLALLISVSCDPEIVVSPPDDDTTQIETPPTDDTTSPKDNEPDTPSDDNVVVDDSSRPEPNYNITEWTGEWADDLTYDVIGDNVDFFYELNTFSHLVVVHYDGNTASVSSTNSGVVSYVDGAHVAIDLVSNGVSGVEILLIGTTTDGSLKVYSDNKYKLSLYGVDITSQRGPAINSQSKKRIYVDLAEGTTNRITDCATYGEDIYTPAGVYNEDRKGAFFAEGNIIISGRGAIVVNGKYNHAIATDGCYYQRPGTTVVVESAAKNGVHVKGDSDDGTGAYIAGGKLYARVAGTAGKGVKSDMNITVAGGMLDIATSGNAYYDSEEQDTSSAAALKANVNIEILGGNHILSSSGSGGKGLNADTDVYIKGGTTTITTSGTRYTYSSQLTSSPKGVKADGNVVISGGELNISVTGRSEGSEGLESKSSITISGGDIVIDAYDDAINAASALTITSGKLYAHSSNNDGIDCNGTLTVDGGLVIGVSSKGAPEAGIDVDNSNNFKINGGTVIGYGATLQSTPSTQSKQCVVSYGGVSVSVGQMLAVLDGQSQPILTFEVPFQISGANFFFSSPELIQGSSYRVESSGTLSGYDDMWHGWYSGGVWSSGTQLTSFTPSSVVTTIGSQGGGPGGGGRPR